MKQVLYNSSEINSWYILKHYLRNWTLL